MKYNHFTPFLVLALIFSSCVAQKKYNDLLGGKARSDREVARLVQVEKEHEALKAEMSDTRTTLSKTEKELSELKDKYEELGAAQMELKSEYDVMAANNRGLLASSSDEKKELTAKLTAQQRELDEKARMLNLLKEELEVKEEAIAEREESITELNKQLDLQRRSLQFLKAGLNDALRGFSASDLTVVEKDGKIYVSMSQNLLFASGSNKLDQKGKDALAKLATVLTANPDIQILVEGHTDTDGTPEFNWDLSVTRATAVVKELTSHGLEPTRVTAAGRAFYVPVDSNDSEQGKARNRRTEIILAPKYDKLYKLLN
ncbi:MAG TPA: OmpA family protein [Saprospiraceae bacterium]|nr:OmpA family protein [Saprospiraceae bacterium]